jgi:hypothetical protein
MKHQRQSIRSSRIALSASFVITTLIACGDAGLGSTAHAWRCVETRGQCRLTLTGPAGSRVTLSGDNQPGTNRNDAPPLELAFAPLEHVPASALPGRPVSPTYALTLKTNELAAPVEIAIPYDKSQVGPGARVQLLRSDGISAATWYADAQAAERDGVMTTETQRAGRFRVVAIGP